MTRSWAKPYHIPNYTLTRGAYKPYNTYVAARPSIEEIAVLFWAMHNRS